MEIEDLGDCELGSKDENRGKVVRLTPEVVELIETRGKYGQSPSDVIKDVFSELEECKKREKKGRT